ncbi:MAG TPA: hypothetical protein VGG75_28740 [Trebonia sp.]|jgi:hypothetical protein
MYQSERLARERHAERLKHAEQSRKAQRATELRRLERLQQRAERRLIDAWRRADEARSMLESAQ